MDDSNREQIIQEYLRRVLEQRNQSEHQSVSKDELHEIARSVGISDDDLMKIEEIRKAALTRALEFIRVKQYDEALHELEGAAAFAPDDKQTKVTMIEVYVAIRHNLSGKQRDKAIGYCKEIIEQYPSEHRAYDAMAKLTGKGESDSDTPWMSRQTPATRIGIIVGFSTLMLVIAIVTMLPIITSKDSDEESASTKPTSTSASPSSPKPVTPPEPVKELSLQWNCPKPNGVELSAAEVDGVIATEMIVGETDGFETSWKLKIRFRNTGTEPIASLTAMFRDYDSQGLFLSEKKVPIITDHDIPLKSGDSTDRKIRLKTKSTTSQYIITVSSVNGSESTPSKHP